MRTPLPGRTTATSLPTSAPGRARWSTTSASSSPERGSGVLFAPVPAPDGVGAATTLFDAPSASSIASDHSPPCPKSSWCFRAAYAASATPPAAFAAVHSPPLSAPTASRPSPSGSGSSTSTTTTHSASMPALTHSVPASSFTHAPPPPSASFAATPAPTLAAFAPCPIRPANGVCSCPPRMSPISGTSSASRASSGNVCGRFRSVRKKVNHPSVSRKGTRSNLRVEPTRGVGVSEMKNARGERA
eukprot:31045-Pelagococcus_subviridis.AAC.2